MEEIHHSFIDLPARIYGFVYFSNFNNYYIIINKNITYELQQKVYAHELAHIKKEAPQKSWKIGINMQHNYIEKEADREAEFIIAEMTAIFL